MKSLPINDVLDDIKQTLNQNSTLILQAPPGAGKSTVVPISLLKESWAEDKIIIMLEPRRVAARMVAQQMAKLLGEEVGQTVGYQVRMDSCKSKQTKLLLVTEAILVRKLQSDPALEDVGLIIFDEFHERSIHTDLSLALSLQVQELLREDLKLLIMSATLNSKELTKLLGDDVPVVSSKGKSYEVEEFFLDENIKQPDYKTISTVLLNTILKAVNEDEGDILVFLSGAKEINSLQKLLCEKLEDTTIEVLPLYSSLSKEKQDKAISKSTKRKIILSTNIAQTSLTIEGVKIVIDTGLEKQSFYNYSNAMNHLEQVFISQDSATQRAGRAGRLSNGKCYKLWHKGKILQESSKPEILRTDLSSFLLEVALWGEDINELKLLDIPSQEVLNSTTIVLQELKMLDEKSNITAIGKKALALGVHPRFAYMILKANELGFAYEACLLASLLIEKDILKSKFQDANIYSRFIHLYEKDLDNSFINKHVAKNILTASKFIFSKLKAVEDIKKTNKRIDEEGVSILTLFSYPDRLAKLRVKNDNKYKLSNGKGAILNKEDTLFNESFLVVPILNANNKDSYINLASRISLDTILKEFESDINIQKSITYNKENKKFDIKEQYFFYELELFFKPISDENQDFSNLLCSLLQKEGLELLTWSKKAKALRQRINFINENSDLEFPSFKEEALIESISIWLEPHLHNIKTVKELESLDTYSMLLSLLPWDKQQLLDTLAPTHIKVPSGSNIKIDYSDITTPILAVKIQEMFGMSETPKILNNKVPLQIHLLNPALRPIQITYDLKSFWENSYDEVKKELFSKYKKHYWPNNPFEAIATNKTKKNMKDKLS
ncbi:ATP-dependent helicase HrpB [Halarcobacter mediterraneus]|uniref:ATP-dependent helicase HrpB n=1 Tax=Halarcobacter mediterraneus TaxID=2023153 RepID=A0A4Q1AVL3_9BACT|nr:ATP-dependent helicase HrpB [Halarcobacter mediterraneus]RXK14085.1 ATP-dependent helicase HrpB [Halarcobacter mediterraneus]